MNFKVVLLDNFRKKAKRLSKKYRSLKTELEELGKELTANPKMDSPLGNDVYKIRLSIKSKSKGKSGGARVITYVQIDNELSYYFPFMTSLKRQQFLIRKFKNSFVYQ